MSSNHWQKIEELYHAALKLKADERAAFLRVACSGDDDLCREVESLLASAQQAESFLESPAIEAAAQAMADAGAPSLVGRQLGSYQIVSFVGAGGMGEVYRARDTRLDRVVALKILPTAVAQDQERMRRFVREAKTASSLNHPNICTIHDIGESEDIHFIAMEYIEGQTLAERIHESHHPWPKGEKGRQVLRDEGGPPGGQPPLGRGAGGEGQRGQALETAEILDIGIQVADALDEAHSNGITHRDIKPSNIMLTRRGHVKVLDFGLAKITRPEGQTSESDFSTTARTQAGIVMGTVQYMSPEQVLGREVDHRSDIFSLGVVLYEMATGGAPFAGSTNFETMDKILHAQIETVSRFNQNVPAELERIIRKSLEKDRERRYQSARDLEIDLKNLKRDSDTGTVTAAPQTTQAVEAKFGSKRFALLIGLPVTLLLLIGTIMWFRYFPPWRENSQAQMKAFAFTDYPGLEGGPAFSPDGRQVAFTWDGPKCDNYDIYVRFLNEVVPHRLTTHTAFENFPAWSPDGQWIAFRRLTSAGSDILVMSSRGGSERFIASTTARWEQADLWSLNWTKDGKFIIATDSTNSRAGNHCIYLFSLETGEREQLTFPAPDQNDTSSALSSDGKTLAFGRYDDNSGKAGIYLFSLEQNRPRSEPRQVISDMEDLMGLAWTPNGRAIIYSSSRGSGLWTLWRVPAGGGKTQPLVGAGDDAIFPNVAPSGDRLIYQKLVWADTIWRIANPSSRTNPRPLKVSLPTRLSGPSQRNTDCEFSPDGKKIAFASRVIRGIYDIWLSDSDGSNPTQLTYLRPGTSGGPSWSPDGNQIAFESSKEGTWDVWVVSAAGGVPRRLTPEKSAEGRPSWSRDGRWIYFASDRSGEFQVWKMPSEGGVAAQVTQKGGFTAFESPDGRWVYFDKFKQDGIWKIHINGGEEIKVVNEAKSGFWSIANECLFLLLPVTKEGPVIKFHDLTRQKVAPLIKLRGTFGTTSLFRGDLNVTPDGSWITFSMTEFPESSLVMVENFH